MRSLRLPLVLLPVFVIAGCTSSNPDKETLAQLHDVPADVQDVQVDQGLDMAMQGYRRFLAETPETAMTPEAMRRLADLQVEKQFGLRAGDGKPREMAAPEHADVPTTVQAAAGSTPSAAPVAIESEKDFEKRTTASTSVTRGGAPLSAVVAGEVDPAGPLEAIALYDRLLAEYPNYEHNDKVLYQKARAYDELGRTDEAIETMERLISAYPASGHYDEVEFRRGEYFFTRRKYRDAEGAYGAITKLGASSSYYELALYKLGWTLYKQEFYEEALHQYIALLDYKVSIGYDFDQVHEEDDERRVTDTFRVVSLSFSNLGGPEVIEEYFGTNGKRGYEDRIYANLGEHYLAKLRYDDAAKTYRAFIALYPFHRASPRFGMRVIDIFTQGNFPKLVLESKKDFATKYSLNSEYWQHFEPAQTPEVMTFLKSNLKDLANHYHAQYQKADLVDEEPANYAEALHWYNEYLTSFPTDPESPPINYQLADLVMEHKDFGDAARQYERTAYSYAPHAQAAAAGYAAIYAHREDLKVTGEDQQDRVKRETVGSSIKFAGTFPQHEHAAAVLGEAADDLYDMKDYGQASDIAQRVIDSYPNSDVGIRRSAWTVVAHATFELADYPRAEHAYAQVLAVMPDDDKERTALVDNLAASIYKQGELANAAQDYRAAANHFIRIKEVAPTSEIRPAAEYDAGAALIRLEDWAAAADVLESFRSSFPEHKLNRESTKQIAFVYRQSGQLERAAGEYDRIASESQDPALRSEALLDSADLYAQSNASVRALDVYTRYVAEFPKPVEMNVETRFKIAQIHQAEHDETRYHEQLAEIVRIDANAGADRTGRTRTLAARSALVLAEQVYDQFTAVKLTQPFESSLQVKQRLMDSVTAALAQLVEYEVADVTAAATYYLAETYFDFSRALNDSQRPTDLNAADLEEYELALEQEAFPFEQKAIDVHEKNLELLRTGVFNTWTEKSLGKLAELVPGRYAKTEISSGFLDAIDNYTYRSPASLIVTPSLGAATPTPAAPPIQTTQLESINAEDPAVEHANP
jgi:tetratricopeptide (TPR) repeat protein